MLRRYNSAILVLLLWSIVDVHASAPFDVRIDHHKVDTTRDLIINKPRPSFSWKIPMPNKPTERNVQQIAYQIQLESIQLNDRDVLYQWDTERVVSSRSLHVPYTSHTDLEPSRYYRLRIRVWTSSSEEASQWTKWIQFRTPIFNLHEHLTAIANLTWIGSTKINMNELRKEFNVPSTSPVTSATVYICGLGYYEFYLNGKNVDPSRKLDPGWTTYEKRTLIASYDVTANITTGANAIGVKLGNGWYSHEQHGEGSYGPPRLVFTMNVTFQTGDDVQVISDLTWTGREGSVKHDSVYNGEIYDARSERVGWAQPGFTDPLSAWITPEVLPSPISGSDGIFVLQDMPPIRAGYDALHFEVDVNDHPRTYLAAGDVGEIKGVSLANGSVLQPVAVWGSDSGMRTYDLGQNMAGWCRLRFKGPSGYGTYIRHGEALVQAVVSNNHATRNIYTENLREATAADAYILRGDPMYEIYEPSFTYHGFRYVAISGPPNDVAADDVECPFVHSETTLIGDFKSTNPIINQIQHNILWGQLSNSMSLPTDCPQRNERRGWMGDAALTVNEALYNFDLVKFYSNFLDLIGDVQKKEDGQVPDFVPGDSYNPDPNWGTALPTIAWQVYRHTLDTSVLDNYYQSVRAYVEYIRKGYNSTGLVNLFCKYGDWVPPPPYGQTNRHLISSFAFLHDVYILLNMSKVLEKASDTAIYSALYDKLAQEFHTVFFNTATNTYADGMQAAQALALALPNVVPASVHAAVVDNLATDINNKGKHVTMGIVSNAQVYPVLSDNGHHDLALELVSSITYPSYGYMFNNQYENATTVWELWDTPSEGPGMNSRNHHMFAAVGAWFYSHLAGIDLSPEVITIRPRMASEAKKHLMKKLDCQLSTPYGIVHVAYTRDERDTIANSIRLRVTVPVNSRAHVMFEPLFVGAQCQKLTEGDQILWSTDPSFVSQSQFNVEKDPISGLMSVHLGSGEYEFQALWN